MTSQITDSGETEKRGRKKIELNERDWKKVESMCAINCTGQEIAGVMGMHYDTLVARIKEVYQLNFSDYYAIHNSKGLVSLRRKQYDSAMSGNTQMLIHLGKYYLGQSERPVEDNDNNAAQPVTVNIEVKDARKP